MRHSILLKCKLLLNLEKENEASTAGPAGISSVGYVNPVFSGPVKCMKRKKKNDKYIK